jgi:orotate phosphoribosyltransferase
MGNQIEGVLEAGQKVVVVEDLISTGKSSLEVAEVLRAHGATVIGMVGLFTYGFPEAATAFEKANVPLFTISNYSALMEVAEDQKIISSEEKAHLETWRLSPSTWNK